MIRSNFKAILIGFFLSAALLLTGFYVLVAKSQKAVPFQNEKSDFSPLLTPLPVLVDYATQCKKLTKEEIIKGDTGIDLGKGYEPSRKDSKLAENYLKIWKELFIGKTNITEDFFSKHFEVYDFEIITPNQFSKENKGDEFFIVRFFYTYDWIVYFGMNKFLVKTDGGSMVWDTSINDYIDLPKGVYLTKDFINKEASLGGVSSIGINRLVDFSPKLMFASCEEAAKSLFEGSGKNKGNLDKINVFSEYGDGLSLTAVYTNLEGGNSCTGRFYIDLVTGEIRKISPICVPAIIN